jgi:hypothetical protein
MSSTVRLPPHIAAIHYDGAFVPAAGAHLPAYWERWQRVVGSFLQASPTDTAINLAWFHTFGNWCVRWLQCGHWSELHQCIFLLQVSALRVEARRPLTNVDQAALLLWSGLGAWLVGQLPLATQHWERVRQVAPQHFTANVAREWLLALQDLSFQEQRLDWYLLYRKCQPVSG